MPRLTRPRIRRLLAPSKVAATPVVWSKWWVVMWAVLAAVLAVLALVLPLRWWMLTAGIGFGVPEWYGLRVRDDAYPPLTSVIRRYLSRWQALTLMYTLGFLAARSWDSVWAWAVVGGVLGFVTSHFDLTYDDDDGI